jgi:hypothetical protein
MSGANLSFAWIKKNDLFSLTFGDRLIGVGPQEYFDI